MFKNKEEFKKEFSQRLIEAYGTTVEMTHPTEKYLVLGEMVRDHASVNWKDTKVAVSQQDVKQVYYFSMEFLLGRSLTSNMKNLGIYDIVVEGLSELGIDFDNLAAMEKDAGLGNGGLGRLAACFMDSAASENLPVNGNCIRYRYGLFRQVIDEQGNQVELPDIWMRIGNPWEIRKPKHSVDVQFWGSVEVSGDSNGDLHFRHVNGEHILAIPYDMPMVGANTSMTNTLRLWSAEPADVSPAGKDYRQYLSEVNDICLNVYPNDSTEEGKYLRLKQQYFFVCAGIDSIINAHLKQYDTLDNLPEKVGIQLNDTHPVLAIPELMRVLMDVYGYSWVKAKDITTAVMSYTNHTVMSEALETWPIEYVKKLLPRIYMIIDEFNTRFSNYVTARYPGEPDFWSRVKIITDGRIHMARLAVVGSHKVNGVAEIHTGLLKSDLFRDYYRMYPERFSNKTNGITPRRWMLYSNPQLRKMLDDTIGKSYEKDFSKIIRLMEKVDDKKTQEAFLKVKQERKKVLADYIRKSTGIIVNTDSIFDSQAKRLHAYKRQLLNILHVIYLYQRMKEDKNFRIYPHTFIFAAKAAPSYVFAKKVIKLINCVARKVNSDPDVNKVLTVVFLPNYSVSMSEYLMNGSDVSEQISTAGKEASGTGNMKFMMNGAITLGTLDGATVEIDRLVGRENDVIFGLTVDQIPGVRASYSAWNYYNKDKRIHKAMNSLIDGTWNGNPDDFQVIYDEIMKKNDEYLVLADFDSYVKAHEQIEQKYRDRSGWARSCLINIAQSAYFSSDRTIRQYAGEIWEIQPLSGMSSKK
ncbi:MAG: glycogen/starch/alpha-glucan phosphorylase [Solobacterium sp.]|nr:glycogen/starch/alpha-glucan phosphorylase [Solobacterium sp.]